MADTKEITGHLNQFSLNIVWEWKALRRLGQYSHISHLWDGRISVGFMMAGRTKAKILWWRAKNSHTQKDQIAGDCRYDDCLPGRKAWIQYILRVLFLLNSVIEEANICKQNSAGRFSSGRFSRVWGMLAGIGAPLLVEGSVPCFKHSLAVHGWERLSYHRLLLAHFARPELNPVRINPVKIKITKCI